jgi:hypothetical protein
VTATGALAGAMPAAEGALMTGVVDVGGWVAPAMELIYEQGTPELRGQWPRIESMLALAALRPGRGDWAHPALELVADSRVRARSGAWAVVDPAPDPPVAEGVLHENAPGRLAELDRAGIALQLLSPGPSLDACLSLPSNLAAGVFAAYNRYVVDYCAVAPSQLGAVLQLHGSEPTWSAQEVEELCHEPSIRAASICLPVRIAPDQRQFDRLWDALERAGLPLLHRPSFCSRIWSPARLLAYLRGSGVLDRHPRLRIGFAAGDRDASAAPLTRSVAAVAEEDPELGSRLFSAVSAAQLARGFNDAVTMLWASDFPLRGSLRAELRLAAGALGREARDVLVGAPDRFLTGGSHD